MNFQALLSSLTGGKVDMAIAGINPTDERKKSMDFSDNYLPTEQKVIIRKADADKFKKVEDLYGKTIGVQKSTTQEALAKDQIKDANIVGLAHVPEVVLELKQGKVDALVVEASSANSMSFSTMTSCSLTLNSRMLSRTLQQPFRKEMKM